NFFADQTLFIESANRIEIATRGEEEGARAEIEPEVKHAKHPHQNAAPQRNGPVRDHARAASAVTSFQTTNASLNMRSIDSRVGIDKKQDVATCGARASVARGSNLPSIDGYYASVSLCGDFRRCVGGRVIHHDDFVRTSGAGSSSADCLNRRCQLQL